MMQLSKQQTLIYTTMVSFLLIIITGCGPSTAPAQNTAAEGPQIEVTEAYINATTQNGALYFEVTNQGGSADKLMSVETTAADVAELHESKIDENEVMRMSPIAGIDLPAGKTVTLAPGGLHVMLVNVDQNLAEGDPVSVTLTFAESAPITIEAEVRQGVAMGHAMEHNDEEHDHDDAAMDHSEEGMEHDHGDARIPNDGAVVRIVSPEDGAEFSQNSDILVEVEVENFELGKDGSHWHVYVDDKSWGMIVGGDTDEALRGLEPGDHEISAYLSIGTHEELADGDKITIHVIK